MQRPRTAVLLFSAFAFSTAAIASDYKAGEVIVKYKDGVSRTRSQMNVLYDSVGVARVKHYSGLMSGYEQLILGENVDVRDAIAELEVSDAVEYAQPNYILYALPIVEDHPLSNQRLGTSGEPCWFPGLPFPPGCEDSTTRPADPGNVATRPELKAPPAEVNPPVPDPQLSQTYGLNKIEAIEAWKIHKGDRAIIVADIDTGVDYNHQDLSFNMWRNPNPGEKNDVVGYDFVHNDGLPYDDHEHGTHTSGTVGAVGDNGVGVSGVSQRVSIMAVKFLSGQGSGTTADAIRSIDYAVEHGAKILSNSWGGRAEADNKALFESIERAKAKDVLFVAAAGNSAADNDGPRASYPAAFDNDNLIAVAATDSNDGMAYFSNYGKKTTHVAAPGVRIYSTVPGDRYKSMSGTSMACPHVAGAAALVWAKNPTWNYKQVKNALLKTVDLLPSLKDKTVTGGRINVLKALQVTDTTEAE